MKIKMTLETQDIHAAIAYWVTQQTGIPCSESNVHKGPYSFDLPYVEIDTDLEDELTDEQLPFVKEAA